MSTLLLSHDCFLDHDTGYGHPERADRLRAIHKVLSEDQFTPLIRQEAPQVKLEDILRAHPQDHVTSLEQMIPEEGAHYIDGDTLLSPKSWEAILRSAGAGVAAIDQVMAGKVQNAFCAVRPPGHHAERTLAMGFCYLNNIAIAASYARAVHNCAKVAIVDFDVHHGNGTQDIFWNEPNVFFGSSHEMPLFPGSGAASERGAGNIFNAPLSSGTDGPGFRRVMETQILPPLEAFAPEFLFMSAGFDAHQNDPLASIELTADDFGWITKELVHISQKTASGRIVSMLEGGYDLEGLATSVAAHVTELMRA